MKKTRRLTALIVALVLAISCLAGCSSSTTTEATATAETASATTETATATVDADGSTLTDGQEVTLNFPCIWVATDTLAAPFAEFVEEFNNDHAGEIKLVIEEQTDYVAYRDKIRTFASSGSMPDILLLEGAEDAVTFAEGGLLLDVGNYMDDAWVDSFSAGLVDSAKVNGSLYAVPFEVAYWPVIYNTELLAEAGYDSFPTTYEELWELCEALEANGVTPMTQMTGENAYTTLLWNSQAAIATGGINGAFTLEGDSMAEAMAITQKMLGYTTSDAIAATAVISRGHFMNEETAIYMNGPWCFSLMETEGGEGFEDKIALATAPVVEGGDTEYGFVMSNVQQRIAFGATDDVAKIEACAEFLRCITDAEWIEKFTVESGGRFFAISADIEGLDRLPTELLELVDNATFLAGNMQLLSTAAQNELPAIYDSLAFGYITPEEAVQMLIDVG